jgi:phage terminase large subunit-like protein
MRPRAKKPKAKTQSSGSSPHDQATAYAKAVVAGQIVAGPHVRAACTRHLRDLKDGKARGLVWSVEQSERVIAYFREVLTVDVEEKDDYGQVESRAVPFVLQPWQAFIVGSLFGWRTKDGFRRFRRAYVEIGKGNGKSPMAAGLGHYMLTATGKIRAESTRLRPTRTRRRSCSATRCPCGTAPRI